MQTVSGVDRTDAPSLSRTTTPVVGVPVPDDLRLALELADIGADLASEVAGPQTSAELRRQISRLRDRVQCPRTPTMHFRIKEHL